MKNPIIILFKIDNKDKLYIIVESNIKIQKLINFYSSIKKFSPKEIIFSIGKEKLSHDCKDSLKDKFIKNTNYSQINTINVEIISKPGCTRCLKNIIKFAKTAFKLIKFSSEIACLICIIIICALSSNDPFEDHLIKHREYIEYFLYIPYFPKNDSTSQNNLSYINKYKLEYEEIDTDIIDSESDNSLDLDPPIGNSLPSTDSSFEDLSFEIPLFSNYTDKTSFCYDMYISIDSHTNNKFSYIFDLNYDTIKNYCIPTLIIFLCYLLSYIIEEIIKLGLLKICKCDCDNFIFFCNAHINKIKLFKTFVGSLKSFFYYLLWYHLERGDIGKYEDFLKCKFVNKDYFDDNFSEIDTLRKCYIVLIIINLIGDLSEKFETLLQSINEEIKDDKTDNSLNEINKTQKELKIPGSEIMTQINN